MLSKLYLTFTFIHVADAFIQFRLYIFYKYVTLLSQQEHIHRYILKHSKYYAWFVRKVHSTQLSADYFFLTVNEWSLSVNSASQKLHKTTYVRSDTCTFTYKPEWHTHTSVACLWIQLARSLSFSHTDITSAPLPVLWMQHGRDSTQTERMKPADLSFSTPPLSQDPLAARRIEGV